MRSSIYLATLACAAMSASASAQYSSPNPIVKNPVKVSVPTRPSSHTTFLANGSDNCANAAANDAINGPGTYLVNTLAATSGSPIANCGAIGNDVWFYYTASSTAVATVSFCNLTGNDTVLAAWADGSPAGNCPTTQLACNDDTCNFQSQIAFSVVAGGKYFIESGGYAGQTYSASFSITETPPATNDGCAGPTVVVGNGPHSFNTSTATTGAEGQAETLCNFYGSPPIYNDVWFTWVATATSTFELSLCNGGAAYDSKMAVYAGAGCPASGSAIACNDDSCGLVSALCFNATAGNTYTIQIGSYSPAGFGTGTFLFTPVASGGGGCTAVDDGSSENSVGLTAGGSLAWMVGFGAIGQSNTITSIETCYGTPLFPGGYVPTGPVTVCVWDDPNDDGNPSDAVLLTSTTAVVAPGSIDTDIFQVITLPTPVTANGVFFVGAVVSHPAGQYPGPLDQSGGGTLCGSGPGSWVVGNTAGPLDINILTNNNVPPQSMTSVGLPGNWLLRTRCGPGAPGSSFCYGDGTGTACPCANNGAAGNGCANSVNAAGANLTATGTASIAADTVVLHGNGMPVNSALYFQGTAQISIVFGDGLRCAGGSVIRLGTKANSGTGTSQYPDVGDLSVSVRGLDVAGDVRDYQVWYRNAAAFCTVSTFNLSNGYTITWGP